MDQKIERLASLICHDSLHLQAGERLFISYGSLEARELVSSLIKQASRMGVFVSSKLEDFRIESLLKKEMSLDMISSFSKLEEDKIDFFDAFIYIKYEENDYELKNMEVKRHQQLSKSLEKALDQRVNHRKWVLLKYPSVLDAYKAKMSYDEFYDYALEAMVVDYKKMKEEMLPLKKMMEETNVVRIVSPGTDISFSICHMPAIICAGEKNIPDGEIYTAPILDSVEGVITYNTPSPYQGNIYHHVSLTFKKGKIVKAVSDEDSNLLDSIFSEDEGARYVGEFALGVNKNINDPIGNILFDEKIYGSIHFTPGSAYEDCDNGNRSTIHWDLVLIQTKEYGGGEIYFDDKLVRKDGIFVVDELLLLNK